MTGGIEQYERLILIHRISVLLQLKVPQITADRAYLGDNEVGLDRYRLTRLARSRSVLGNGLLRSCKLVAGGGRGNGSRHGLLPFVGRSWWTCSLLRVPLPAVEQ